MAKAEKVEKAKAPARTNRKVSRAEKVARRLNGISAKTPFKLKNAIFTVEAIAKVPQSIQGYIVSRDADTIVFRHKRSNASKKMVVTIFPVADVLELFGNEGEVSELTVMRETPIRKAQGTVSCSGNAVTVKTTGGESVTFYRSSSVVVNIYAEDEEGSTPSARGPKKADTKVVDIKTKKKKRAVDDDDGEL